MKGFRGMWKARTVYLNGIDGNFSVTFTTSERVAGGNKVSELFIDGQKSEKIVLLYIFYLIL